MNVQSLNLYQILDLFNKKDLVNNGAKREFFSNVFYDFNVWPIASLRDFWMLKYVNRLRLTNFCFGNGMSHETLLEMLTFYHTHSDQNIHRWKEISELWNRLKNEMLPHYYYFSMHFGFEIYFDGNKRVHRKPAGPVVDGPMYNSPSQTESTFFCKPKVYEMIVRNRVIAAENESAMQRKKLREKMLKAPEESKNEKEAVRLLEVNSIQEIDEMFPKNEEIEENQQNEALYHLKLNSPNELSALLSEDTSA